MKKLILCTILLFLVFGAASCSKDEIFINPEEVSVNTIVARTNGNLQVATVEEFDKSYYKIDELKDFIQDKIDSYNKTAGEEKITVDTIEAHDKKAVMILSYSGMEPYSTFNEVPAAYFNGGLKEVALDLPTTLINATNESLASTQEILQNEKYKILVLYEPYDIIVEGKVKYYSENAEILEENKVKGAAEGLTVVVYK